MVTVNQRQRKYNFAFSWPERCRPPATAWISYYILTKTARRLATLTSNPAKYIASNSNSIASGKLPGVNKGSNVVRVVAVDTDGNYSPSNLIIGSFSLNSNNPDPAKNLTVSDASIKSASLWRASLAWDHPDYQETVTTDYTVQRSTTAVIATYTTNGTAYVDIVAESKQYYWRVGSSDTTDSSIASPSYTNAVTIVPKGSYTDPAYLTSVPVVEGLTTRKAQIKWSTSRNSDSKVASHKSGEY